MTNRDPNEDQFRLLRAAIGREIVAGGERFLFFGGTAYLGLNTHPSFLDLYIEGLQQYGINNGTSRSNNVQLGIYAEAEKFAANYWGSEAALLLSSGFLAAQLVVKHFSSYGEVLYAPHSHPALWISDKPHHTLNFEDWIVQTVHHINSSNESRFVIISNSLNALTPEKYDFSLLETILPSKEIILIVDDSHGIGVIGTGGKGILPSLPTQKFINTIVIASMAKALGLDAGLILASDSVILELKKSSLFLGASPSAPATLYTLTQAGSIFENEYRKLQENITFIEENTPIKLHSIKGLPIFYSDNQTLAAHLRKEKIIISNFPYPQPSDPILNRIVLSSAHTPSDLSSLITALGYLS